MELQIIGVHLLNLMTKALIETKEFLQTKYRINCEYVDKNADIPAHLVFHNLDGIFAIERLHPQFGKLDAKSRKGKDQKFIKIRNMIFKKGIGHDLRNKIIELHNNKMIGL